MSFLKRLFNGIKLAVQDLVCFIRVSILLCKEDPFERDKKRKQKRYEKCLAEATEAYKKTLEEDHKPNEVEEQMQAAEEMLKARAEVMSYSFNDLPTKTEQLFKHFHEMQSRWFMTLMAINFLMLATAIAVALVKL